MMISKIKAIRKLNGVSLRRYDIETSLGNFFANGVLIHNCSSSYAVTRKRNWLGLSTTFWVCSRNLSLRTPHPCVWWKVAGTYNIREKLESVGKDICIQGEIVGPGVQGNKYGLKELQLFVFNVWDLTEQRQLRYQEMIDFCTLYDFQHVPVILDCVHLLPTVPEMVECANGYSQLNGAVKREGLVFRTMRNMPDGRPVSFKVLSPTFLLEHQDEENYGMPEMVAA